MTGGSSLPGKLPRYQGHSFHAHSVGSCVYQMDYVGGMLFYQQEVWLLLAKNTQRV